MSIVECAERLKLAMAAGMPDEIILDRIGKTVLAIAESQIEIGSRIVSDFEIFSRRLEEIKGLVEK